MNEEKISPEQKREEIMNRLNTILDKYEESNENIGHTMALINLENVVEHIEKCYDFDKEFPTEELKE